MIRHCGTDWILPCARGILLFVDMLPLPLQFIIALDHPEATAGFLVGIDATGALATVVGTIVIRRMIARGRRHAIGMPSLP